MPEKSSSDPREVADMLEALARKIRTDPSYAAAADAQGLAIAPSLGEGPSLGALDVFTDEHAVTVTAETRNADANSVHVSVLQGRLLIGLGDGPLAYKRDLPLPADVDEESAVATFRNGILDVVLPLRRR